ncbi:hypothetical protein BDZ45DRAFT_749934 [Acephala macrosclerotiorum]|nr:hypothetical protein BDZ45DRAFT_749934 [Acephala macrosclerotiorum]
MPDLAGPGTQASSGEPSSFICIKGSEVELQDLKDFDGEHLKAIPVCRRVRDTVITGFTVQGFSVLNIAVVGAQDAPVSRNTVSSSAQQVTIPRRDVPLFLLCRKGLLDTYSDSIPDALSRHASALSRHTKAQHQAQHNPFYLIGICVDDVSTVSIAHNDISGYFIGLCVQISGADIHEKLSTHANADTRLWGIGWRFCGPGHRWRRLYNNGFSNTLPGCPPAHKYSSGITISDATNIVVRNNKFSRVKNGGQAAAMVLLDNGSEATAMGNDIENNKFTDNDLDIFKQTTGIGNNLKNN